MSKVFLLFGSNLGNRKNTITRATAIIERRIGTIIKNSAFYESEPWGFENENSFINQLVIYDTLKMPFEILDNIKETENELGRVRTKVQFSSRTIDIDILYYETEIIREKNLIIPHPGIKERKFALEPLVEIEPEFKHPVFNKTNQELLDLCEDNSWVKKIS